MTIHIRQVIEKEDYRRFAQFGLDLYKGNPYFIPPLISDVINTIHHSKNPAFEHCEATFFLAYKGETIVGRIGVIINHKANKIWNQKNARFGFVDFIDNEEIVDALFQAAEEWAFNKGMEKLQGPMGFCNMDAEGMLIEGFDQMSTIATIYNYPYYPKHLQRLGYTTDQEAIEYLITIPREIPERFERVSEIVKKRFGVTIKNIQRKKDVYPYAREIFKLINLAYKDLYGFVELTDRQIDHYVEQYIPLLRLDFLTLVVREKDNKLVGIGIGLPSVVKAMQKAQGKLFPFGWYHLMRAVKRDNNPILELLLVAIDPEYQGKGLNALIMGDFNAAALRLGYVYAESNPELVDNTRVQSMWNGMETKLTKKRRVLIKQLSK